MSRLAWLNALPLEAARSELRKCCGSRRWVEQLVDARPFGGEDALFGAADAIWAALGREDWLEAFAAHPRIGNKRDVDAKSGTERAWSEGEQAGAARAADATAEALQRANADYEALFGHIYIVCATGKSAEEMLALARARLANDPETELRVAAEEQRRITRIRLRKLLDQETSS
ncbi:MAG: 2-oxo-4-hydroxy-4-carboxy-5-ureidoimidazoline decarboxylase [Deltaproteobacteria bacterium]|nr:2-oxo-4-hydroxy-4-carboxy-5-ureidoimidazoline decarboxylase [Deltaproteobacteria bacterium]